MFKIKEFNIRISLYFRGCERDFKVYSLKTTSLADARQIAKALKEYHAADYAGLEIIQ